MTDGQSITLSEPISKQRNGIILVWTRWVSSGTPADDNWNYVYVPRFHALYGQSSGGGTVMPMGQSASGANFRMKYVYIRDQEILGHGLNTPGDQPLTLRWVLGY